MSHLRQATGAGVQGPARECVPEPLTRLADGEDMTAPGLRFPALDIPGRTAGPIACDCMHRDGAPLPVYGETLFSGGCARLFDETSAQMPSSAGKLAAAPGSTRVCCTHEYTLGSLKFARAVEPNNNGTVRYVQRCEELRAQDLPTLPSTIENEEEERINPFLRMRPSGAAQVKRAHDGATRRDDVAVFATLRQWKNEFK